MKKQTTMDVPLQKMNPVYISPDHTIGSYHSDSEDKFEFYSKMNLFRNQMKLG